MKWTSAGGTHGTLGNSVVSVAVAVFFMGNGAFLGAQQPQHVRTATGIEVRGRFVDEGKKPIADMRVQIGHYTKGGDGADVCRPLMDVDGRWMIVTTDAEGRFDFRGLGSGAYCILARPNGMYAILRLLTGEMFVFELPDKAESVHLGDRVVKIVSQ